MDAGGANLAMFLLVLLLLQPLFLWLFLRHRYRGPMRRLEEIARDLAAGRRPRTYLVEGAPPVEALVRHLETVGQRLEDLRRQGGESEFNLGVLLANMAEGVVVVDVRHVIRVANGAVRKLFQPAQELAGRTVLEGLRSVEVERLVAEALARGEPRGGILDFPGPAPGGVPLHLEVHAAPIRTAGGRAEGVVVVFHDVTELVQLEAKRREFVANVSHELRTPLTIFRGNLETLLLYPGLPPEESRRALEAMQRHSFRLQALVEDLLHLTRLESDPSRLERVPVAPEPLLRRLAADWRQRRGAAEVELGVAIDGPLPALSLDLLRFEQVILNLLENALAYSNPPRRIGISAALRDGVVEIRVGDNGIGIPPADLPRIFERFYRVDKDRNRASGGTGLGLAICQQIVEAHGGTIAAESRLGEGTTIVIRLPAGAADRS